MSNIIIRPFKEEDRDAVRRICCDTADKGGPIETFFKERRFAADILSRYYTDYEPASTFVAEAEGEVVGYLMGCLDNRRYGLAMFWIIVPLALLKGFGRGLFFRRDFWDVIGAMVCNAPRLFQWRKASFHSHQSHIHMGVAVSFRRRKAGVLLLEAFMAYAKTQGAEEIAASVHDGNVPARRFFEQHGFHVQASYPMVIASPQGRVHYNSLLYVKHCV